MCSSSEAQARCYERRLAYHCAAVCMKNMTPEQQKTSAKYNSQGSLSKTAEVSSSHVVRLIRPSEKALTRSLETERTKKKTTNDAARIEKLVGASLVIVTFSVMRL